MSPPALSELAEMFVPSVPRVNTKDVKKAAARHNARLSQWSMIDELEDRVYI